MVKDSVAAEMRRHAQAAAEMVRAEYKHDLDFSEPTVGAVEAILNGLWRAGGASEEFIATTALLFGAYLGELIRTAYPQARWARDARAPDGVLSAYVQVDDVQVFPMTWCGKQLLNGPSEGVVAKYLAFRKVIDEPRGA